MHIVFSNYDSPDNPWYNGGGAKAIHEFARRLTTRHQVTVITGAYPGSADIVSDGVKYHRIGSAFLGPKAGQLLFQALLPWQVKTTPHDVWVESMTPPFSTACLQWFTPMPVIALTQVLSGQAMAQRYHLPFDRAERAGLSTYRHAIALNPHLASYIQRASPKANIAVIPNGIEQSAIDCIPPAEPPAHVLFLGRIDIHQKGLDLLLDAWPEAHSAFNLPLLLAGAGTPADEATLRQRLAAPNLASIASWCGRVVGDAKAAAFAKAALFVMPSRYEASPLTLLEAFCHAKPVIIFGIDELAWVPDTACLKVKPFDTRQLAEAVRTLANDPARARSLGLAGKAFARNFSWESIAARYEEFIVKAGQLHKA